MGCVTLGSGTSRGRVEAEAGRRGSTDGDRSLGAIASRGAPRTAVGAAETETATGVADTETEAPCEATVAESAGFGIEASRCTVATGAGGRAEAETETEATGVETVAAMGVLVGVTGTVADTDTGGTATVGAETGGVVTAGVVTGGTVTGGTVTDGIETVGVEIAVVAPIVGMIDVVRLPIGRPSPKAAPANPPHARRASAATDEALRRSARAISTKP